MKETINIDVNSIEFVGQSKEKTTFKLIARYFQEYHNGIISTSSINKYILHLKEKKHRNRYVCNLKGILKKAISQYLMSEVASQNINTAGFLLNYWDSFFRTIKIKKSRITYDARNIPKPDEIKEMMDREQNPVRAMLIGFTFSLGLRNSEVRNIKLSDIQRHATIHKGTMVDLISITSKNQNKRTIPVRSDYIDFVIWLQHPTTYLFERLPGIPFSERTFQRIVEEASNRIGRDFHPHLLRHSLGSLYYEKTLDIIGGSNFLGNDSKTYSETYVHHRTDLDVIDISPVDELIEIARKKVV